VTLGIAGVGLIGGSIALRARERGIKVIGLDAQPGNAGLVDRYVDSLEALADASATIVIALPLDATLEAIDVLRRAAHPKLRLVLDVTSVKVPVVERSGGWDIFIATHPIAGAEGSGPRAARSDLFVDRVWTYVPADPARDAAVRSFINMMGARPLAIDPAEHDRSLALTSHLPQVVVAALAALLHDRDPSPELAGPGLASTLRLAGSSWELWEPILAANASSLAPALRELGERLTTVAGELEAGTLLLTASYFKSAREAYEAFVKPRR